MTVSYFRDSLCFLAILLLFFFPDRSRLRSSRSLRRQRRSPRSSSPGRIPMGRPLSFVPHPGPFRGGFSLVCRNRRSRTRCSLGAVSFRRSATCGHSLVNGSSVWLSTTSPRLVEAYTISSDLSAYLWTQNLFCKSDAVN